jgi:hypothetical protein
VSEAIFVVMTFSLNPWAQIVGTDHIHDGATGPGTRTGGLAKGYSPVYYRTVGLGGGLNANKKRDFEYQIGRTGNGVDRIFQSATRTGQHQEHL